MKRREWKRLLALGLCVANVTSWNMISFAAQNMKENVALNKTVVSSSNEADSLVAAKAVDGNKSTRWSSRMGLATETNPHWIYVDLGEEMTVGSVRIAWEYQKANKYKIQIAKNGSDPANESSWKDVKVCDTHPASRTETITLETPEQARYVRIYVTGSTHEDPGGGTPWSTISIYEIEIFGGLPPKSLDEIMGDIKVTLPEADDTEKKLKVEIPDLKNYPDFVDSENAENYEIKYNGTDYEQVIGDNYEVYETVEEVTVNVSFKVTNKETGAYQFKEIPVTIPASITPVEGENAAPNVLPELREWDGGTGDFVPADESRIVIGNPLLRDMAESFKEDYKEVTGKDIEIVYGRASDVKVGEYFFDLTADTSKGLQKEGYLLNITDKVEVTAETTTGAYWATRTILQSLKKDGKIPQGMAKDYPLYEVRGFILDVGRKTFTMDYLQQTMKEMSWYKLNDFQVHINDNFIFLENYTRTGRNPMTAYSGFRLESDIKKGDKVTLDGQEYTYSADLTNTDVWYSKEEFKDFILDSRVRGVNIVPEIDTPAHSLALTKVLPELRHGTNGRDNDHLALATKYNACLEFVQTIFDEYMGEDLTDEEVVFDKDTIVHMGADEYSAAPEAYRKFADDMLKYVQDSGRTARIWGSLTSIKGNTPVRAKDVQMNLWNFGWANMDKMYEEGFDLINCNDGGYYIVPNSGYYHPNGLDNNAMYNQPINSISGVTIPAGDKQMIGGAFAVWNDMIDDMDNGVSEYDIYKLIEDTIPVYAANLWGKKSLNKNQADTLSDELGNAPGTNFDYNVEKTDDVVANYPMDDAAAEGLSDSKNVVFETVDGRNVLSLMGKESYVRTKSETVGLGNSLRVKVKRTSNSTEDQILFESPYGSIKAVQKETGKVGFTRENFDYSFNYTLPIDEWVELEFTNEKNVAKLYVNGELVDVLGDGIGEGELIMGTMSAPNRLWATTMFPIEKIGSATNAFIGYVDDVRIGTMKEYNSTMELDYAVMKACAVADLDENATLKGLVEQANAIFKQYDPAADDISSLVTSINAEVEKISSSPANYERVELYREIIENLDLSIFEDAQVNALNVINNSIREKLPKSMQNIVDGYADALKDALAALKLKEVANVNFVDNATLKATASSQENNNEGAAKAIDGNNGSIWHSQYNKNTPPHWISFEMAQPTKINALTYVPRSGGGNGNVKSYEIQISDDGETFTKHKEGTLPENGDTKVIEFDAVTTKHVRLHIKEATGGFGSAAEIKIHLAEIAPDTEGLRTLLDNVGSMDSQGFSTESWKAVTDKVAEGEQLLESSNVNANDIEVLKREIYSAMADTQEKSTTVETITLSPESMTLTVGEIKPLLATITPENATDKKVIWTSSDEEVAVVGNGGVVALKAGTATITATVGEKSAICEVTVNSVPVTEVSLNESSVSLKVGETQMLTASILPDNASIKEVVWTSSAQDVVAIEDGLITALKVGTATITATAGEQSATCTVTVKAIPVEELRMNKETASVYVGNTELLTTLVSPYNATETEASWSSSAEDVATVENGVVTALKAGTTIITATVGEKSVTCEITVENVLVENVTLNKNAATLQIGATETLTATVTPDNATDKEVTWTTSDPTVATVENGVVTALKAGKATITVKTANDKTATCEVTVVEETAEVVPVENVTLNKEAATLQVGATETLAATVTPDNATDKEVTWTTSDPTVATVENGVVTALKAGKATITATAGDKSATCEVTVVGETEEVIPVENVTLDKDTASLQVGATETLTATVTPDNATDKEVTWTTSDPTVATVENGVVTALKAGTTIITATVGEESATCEVTVVGETEEVIPVESVTLDKDTATLQVGATETLAATVTPDNATDKEVTWTTSDPDVATVENGVVKALKAGKATITATAGEQSATCTITVEDKAAEEADKIATYRAEISKLIAEGAGYKKEEYTPESWSGYQEVLKKVTAVMDNQEATSQQLKDSLAQLKAGIFHLKKKDPVQGGNDNQQGGNQQPGDNNQQGGNQQGGNNAAVQEQQKVEEEKKAIESLKTQGSTLKPAEYTTESWNAYQAALNKVNTLISSGTATSAQLNAAKAELEKTMGALVKAPDTSTPDQTPEEKPEDTLKHKKNQKLTFKDASYKVTKAGNTGGEVALTKYNGKAKKFTTPKTITVEGVKYKVTSVGNNAFKGNKTLTNIIISTNVKTIGNNVFQKCAKLTNVTIGKDVTKLGKNLFKNSKKLKTIVFKTTKLTANGLAKKSLAGIGKTTRVRVPKKQLNAYKKFFKTKGLSKSVKITK